MITPPDQRRNYISRLRNDPRTKALFDSFIYKATHEVRSISGYENLTNAQPIAQRAVMNAMAFVLDNDGEYQMLLEENERLRQQIIDITKNMQVIHKLTITNTGDI